MEMEEENSSNLELSEILADFVDKVTKVFKVLYKFEILSLMIFYKKNAHTVFTIVVYFSKLNRTDPPLVIFRCDSLNQCSPIDESFIAGCEEKKRWKSLKREQRDIAVSFITITNVALARLSGHELFLKRSITNI